MKSDPKLARFSWALYDFANTIFSVNIISIYFVLWLTIDKGCTEIYYGFALVSSIFFAAVLMPLVGEISDRLKRRLPFLICFTLGCVLFTALLGLVEGLFLALLFFALANFCYQLADVIYNSLLSQVGNVQIRGRTSGLGVSLGCLGAILSLVLVRLFLDIGTIEVAFISTAVLFLLFALPAFIFIKDPPHPYIPKIELELKTTFFRLLKGLAEIQQERSLIRFLIFVFLSLNAVGGLMAYMGVYAKRVMLFNDAAIIYFISTSILAAMVGAYAFGWLTDYWGSKDTLNLAAKLCCLDIFLATLGVSSWMFWMLGPLAGICLGGMWVSARTMLIELVPQEKIGRMFGVFGMTAKFSAISGPLGWTMITSWIFAQSGILKYRLAMGSAFVCMFTGYLLFQGVRDPRKF